MVALPAPSRLARPDAPDNWPPDEVRDFVHRAEKLASAGMIEAALEQERRAAELAPEDPYIHNNLGVTLAGLGRNEEALEQFQIAVKLDPKHPGFICHEAFALAELGRVKEAIDMLGTLEHSLTRKARRAVLNHALRKFADEGFAAWSGGKPKGSKHPVKLLPGPSITELVREGRR